MQNKQRLHFSLKNWKLSGLFKKFFISYLSILIIPLCFATFAYRQAVNIIQKDSTDAKLFMLEHIQNSMDQFVQNMEETSINLALDSNLRTVSSFTEPAAGSPDYYWFYNYLNKTKTINLDQGGIDAAFYIFFNKSQAVFTRSDVDFGFQEYYEQNLSFDNMSFSQWKRDILETNHLKTYLPSSQVSVNGESKSAIPFLVSVPFNKGSTPDCTIVSLIDEENIKELLRSVNMEKSGWTYILDENGQCLTSCFSDDRIKAGDISADNFTNANGYFTRNTQFGDMLCVYAKSRMNNWTYVTISPLSDVMGHVYSLKQTCVYVALAALIIGLFLSVCLTYRNAKPFQDAVQTLKAFLAGKNDTAAAAAEDAAAGSAVNESEYLKKGISSLISNNIDIQSILSRQSEVLKNMFWERLFSGELTEKKKMKALMEHINLNFDGQEFIAVLIKIIRQDDLFSPSIFEELDVLRSSIEKMLQTQVSEKSHFHLLNENEAVLLLSFDQNYGEQLKQKVESAIGIISREMFQYFHVFPIFGVGNPCKKLDNVFLSLNEARQALDSADDQKEDSVTVFWYNQMSSRKVIYYYPGEIEGKLINCVKAGRKKQINELLNKIYEQNYEVRRIPTLMENLLFHDMEATLVKIISTSNLELSIIEEDISILEKCDTTQFFDSIRNIYSTLCDRMSDIKMERHSKLKNEILDFVNENFSNSDLCVYVVASHFNLSESYFSQLFKECTGTNFSTYVENTRIDLACKLIKNNQLSIDNIAQQCGYNNTHSFRRAFKKVTGIVPSDYRP